MTASSEPGNLVAARATFAEHVHAKYAALNSPEPNAKAANHHVDATDILVTQWATTGAVQDILVPLLADNDPALRCSAASYLLYHGESEKAMAVLEALAEDDDLGTIASMADTALMVWEDSRG
jgi:hypothetical protein